MRRLHELIVITTAACGGSVNVGQLPPDAGADAPLPADAAAVVPDAEPELRFDIDIVERGTSIEVHLDERAASCCTPRFRWPGEGGCTDIRTTQGCSCDPWGCITSVRLERDGKVIADAADQFADGPPFTFELPDFTLDPVEVVIEGCDAVERRLVGTAPRGWIIPEEFETDGEAIRVPYVTSEDATHTMLSYRLLAGRACLGSALADAMLTPANVAPMVGAFELESFTLDEPAEGAHGAIRVWHTVSRAAWEGYAPVDEGGGRWSLPAYAVIPFELRDHESDEDFPMLLQILPGSTFTPTDEGDELLEVVGRTWFGDDSIADAEPFSYVATPTTDEISIALEGGLVWTGSYPHTSAMSGLLYMGRSIITMSSDAEPGTLRQLGIRIEGYVGDIARPIP
jgi:hypothetical protein